MIRSRTARALGITVVALAFWEAIVRLGLVNRIILAAPSDVVLAIATDGGIFLRAFSITVIEIVLAIVISWTLGIALGMIAGSSRRLAQATAPVLSSLFAIPLIIIYPLLMAWLGIGPGSKVAFGVLSGFFPIALNTIDGVRAIEPRYLVFARSIGATRLQTYVRIVFPLALPSMISGLRVGTGLVVIGVIVTEMLASLGGIGFLISYHRTLFNTGHVYFGIALALLLAVAVNVGLTRLERRVGLWRIREQAGDNAMWMVGVDTGGTFTDLVAFEPGSGELRTIKVPSEPADPSAAVINALDELFRGGLAPREIGSLVHGTTVATNAVLESAGVRAGLLITRGFRAVYEARGWVRPGPTELLDTFFRKPPLLVPQSRTEEIPERMDYQGSVLEPLDEQAVRAAARRLKAKGVQAVAVCYLFSFRNPAHEERTAEILAEEEPAWRISLSSRVLPVIREYPRLSTTVIDTYVGPIIERYLLSLDRRLQDHGIATPQIFLMQSNGGLMRITMGARFPNQTLTSGPAAGVVAGAALTRATGRKNVVTLDIGGTSTDISVIADGRTSETSSGRIAGQDVGTPMLAVHTLGAGGGTIAWIGRDGLMKVGPQSSGAMPGPACYGRGGTAPTVTDANLVLGALGTKSVLGGRMALDLGLAERAIMEGVARPLGLDLVTAAAGILKIVNTNMAVDLRLAFQSRGEDPRRFALLAFGGAGPLHAAYLARDLGIPEVIVPPHPGLTSAMGLLQTDVRHLYLRSAVGLLSSYPVAEINGILADLRRRALDDVAEEGLDRAALRLKQQFDLRYPHQGYHLTVDGPDGEVTEAHKPAIKAAFDELHRRTYGASAPEEDAELVTLRLVAEVPVEHLRLPRIASGDGRASDARIAGRQLYDLARGAFADADVYDRARLRAGDRLTGPAIVEQYDSTTVVLAGQALTVDEVGNLLIAEQTP